MTGAKKKGRPSLYTEALAAKICRRLAEGETLRAICRDEALEIADDALGDWTADKDGKKTFDHEHVQRSRLRVDTRKWAAGKLARRTQRDPSQGGTRPPELEGRTDGPLWVDMGVTP